MTKLIEDIQEYGNLAYEQGLLMGKNANNAAFNLKPYQTKEAEKRVDKFIEINKKLTEVLPAEAIK